MRVLERFLTENPCYRSNRAETDSRYKRFHEQGPQGLMLHSVGCAQPSAEVFCRRWNSPSYNNACVHAFIDADTGDVWQTLPWTDRGWHCGGTGNNTHVGVEMCEPDAIRYDSATRFTVLDREKAVAAARRCYESAVELFATLCLHFGLDPMTDILSHAEGYARGIATNHGDPEHLWRGLGLGYTMDGFRADVSQVVEGVQQNLAADEDARQRALTEQVQTLVDQALRKALGPWIAEISDIPHEGVRQTLRRLLDCGAVNGGTPAEKNPDDIGLPYNIVRAVAIAAKYAEMQDKATGVRQ